MIRRDPRLPELSLQLLRTNLAVLLQRGSILLQRCQEPGVLLLLQLTWATHGGQSPRERRRLWLWLRHEKCTGKS
jgi:hypothetical protein